MSRILYFDCFSGVSGDMVLGALLDLGLPMEGLRDALGSLGAGRFELRADRVSRAGVAATKFRLIEDGASERTPDLEVAHAHAHPHPHDHRHDQPGGPHHHAQARPANRPHHHEHRSLADIARLIDGSNLGPEARDRAKTLFYRLGEAEAAIHQVPLERVHLHEVGSLDSIIDIVGAVYGLEWVGATTVQASPLNVGSGTVECEHGTFPVPAPATARLLDGVPIYSSGVPAELVTPTGALLVTAYASRFGPLPPMRLERTAYGAGDRELSGTPNVLRLLLGSGSDEASPHTVVRIEFETDDMNPQLFGPLMTRLYEAGALEVFYLPIQMKKNRPGTLVTVIAPPALRQPLSDIIFRETTTIGVRFQELARECLDRAIVTVTTPVGPIRFKVARRGSTVLNAVPEFDDCAARAAEHDRSVKEVQALAMKAYLDTERT